MADDKNNDGYMTAGELAGHFGLSDRHIKNHLKDAGTRIRSTQRKQPSGQTARVYLVADVDAFVKTRGAAGRMAGQQVLPAAIAAPLAAAADERALSGAAADEEKRGKQQQWNKMDAAAQRRRDRDDDSDDGEFVNSEFPEMPEEDREKIRESLRSLRTDDLFGLVERLRDTERKQHALYLSAVNNPRDIPDPILSMRLKNYQDASKAVRTMESELPAILENRGRYIDSRLWIPLLKHAANALRLTVMNSGAILAEECAGKSSVEIRATFDRYLAAAIKDFEKELKL
jgi:hypothetical protein